ncbi:DUF3021 domain-containing protein [Mammaliicoccus sciuri]|uniref:DUF3021 domain-containing protein n=2 Tax=Sporosarcina newyorkensis TaxID=759851 RepID=A0A1T4XZK7_9BACL|nr:DUF3021 domain-containing protein [Sporosarcina newyorkensis]EGQ26861.1 hypothetical protein HMPREF9372_1133 [Sporosarcina newyorkensis 2681]SKA95004.1 Protein of unknown function [Sporosarcina newyorkensis]
MNSFLFRSMIGIFFGGFLAVVITSLAIYASDLETLKADVFVKNALGTIFCGWFFSVTPLYFENESWSLLKQTLYHFITVLILYFITAFGIGWFTFTAKSFLTFTGLFLGLYIASWIGFYLYYANEAKKLNEELKEW